MFRNLATIVRRFVRRLVSYIRLEEEGGKRDHDKLIVQEGI